MYFYIMNGGKMKLRLRHIIALNDYGLDFKDFELISEGPYDFTFRNKETKKTIYIRY